MEFNHRPIQRYFSKPIKNKDYDYNGLHFRDHAHSDNIAERQPYIYIPVASRIIIRVGSIYRWLVVWQWERSGAYRLLRR